MRWGYKTIQYGLKKEGLLGSSFLDEAEVEQSLNEFGQAGWQVKDGVVTVRGEAANKAQIDLATEYIKDVDGSPSSLDTS